MHDYARHLVASTAAQVLPCRGNALRATIVRQFLPYCIAARPDGRGVLLNRSYKPLGWPPRRTGFVDFNDPMFDSMAVEIPPDFLEFCPRETTEHGTFLFLYGRAYGEDSPWSDNDTAWLYLGRLKNLIGAERMDREGCQP
jgi:hypothetical protein